MATLLINIHHYAAPTGLFIIPSSTLSLSLTFAEERYWPTKLGVSCLVWALRKVRHLVEAATLPFVIYTDHASTVGISKQTSMNPVSSEHLNLRLVRASIYIQQFHLQVYHRQGKENVLADALSRMPIRKPNNSDIVPISAIPATSNVPAISNTLRSADKQASSAVPVQNEQTTSDTLQPTVDLPNPDELTMLYNESIQASRQAHDWYVNSFELYTRRDARHL